MPNVADTTRDSNAVEMFYARDRAFCVRDRADTAVPLTSPRESRSQTYSSGQSRAHTDRD